MVTVSVTGQGPTYIYIYIFLNIHIKIYRFILGVASHYGCQISIFPQVLVILKTTFSILRFLAQKPPN